MSARRAWTRDELLVAMNLYCRLPFGRLHQRNREIITVAEALGRTPGSLAMKLCNLASFDPVLRARGVKGLSGASAADRGIWEEFNRDWEGLAVESEQLFEGIVKRVELPAPRVGERRRTDTFSRPPARRLSVPAGPPAGPDEKEASVRVRLSQRFFRRAVLASYGSRCCISGMPVPELLTASHILPWSSYPAERVNPRNGLCLSKLHDAAFDQGLITLDDKMRIRVSKQVHAYLPDEAVEKALVAFAGKPIRAPERFAPEPSFLRVHRETIFRG